MGRRDHEGDRQTLAREEMNENKNPSELANAGNVGAKHSKQREVGRWTRIKQSWSHTSGWNKLAVVLTAVIAMSNIIYACYARKQFVVMSGQLTQMQSSGVQTDQLISLYQNQLTELQKQSADTHNLAQAATDQVSALKTSNALNIASNRPWVGQVEGPATDVIFHVNDEYAYVQYIWRLRNSGHRPARITSMRTTESRLRECTMTPDFDQSEGFNVPEDSRAGNQTGSKPIVLPDGRGRSTWRNRIPIADWNKIKQEKIQYCIYMDIEYRDVDYPQAIHHTRDCEVLMPNAMIYTGCAIEYSHAD